MLPDAVELIKTIKKTAVEAMEASKPAAVVFGKVSKVSPLRIVVDQKLTLGASQLVLTRNVCDYTAEMSVNHTTGNALAGHSHSMSGTVQEGGEPPHRHGFTGNMDTVNLAHSHSYSGRKSFTVHNGLVVGDEVLLLRQQGGQKYIVVDRIK